MIRYKVRVEVSRRYHKRLDFLVQNSIGLIWRTRQLKTAQKKLRLAFGKWLVQF